MDATREVKRICPVCEATCGLTLTVTGNEVTAVRGNAQDPFSRGFICPKGVALKDLHADPDRLRQPMIKRNGRHVEVSWAEAWAEIAKGLGAVKQAGGNDAIGIYIGNPAAHKASLGLYTPTLIRAAGTKNSFSASTVDQMPKQLSAGLMFGGWVSIPVPDIDRANFILMLGANPMASNGSLWTVPDFRKRLEEMQARGGKLITVDPRLSRTAELADRHIFIKPGTDALFLAALATTIFASGKMKLGVLADWVTGLDEIRAALAPFTAEAVAAPTGIDANVTREIADFLLTAGPGAIYGRIGTCTQAFGTTASYLVDLLNVITGNLDVPGGAMFPRAAAFSANTRGEPGRGKGVRTGRRKTRVRGLPEVAGEFPAATMAEEIETPGEGQIKALITVAGNPVISTPNGARLDKALERLDFMVSVDIYLNATTKHADVILPGVSPLEDIHYDTALNQFTVRNVARFSQAVFDKAPGQPDEWEILVKLALILSGQGAEADPVAADDAQFMQSVRSIAGRPGTPFEALSAEAILAATGDKRGAERQIDFGLRTGPYGDLYGLKPEGLSLDKLIANPDGIDLGPLEPRLPEALRTPSGKIELAADMILEDIPRLKAAMAPQSGLTLVGRRDIRTNNSWMGNLPLLAKGPMRCTLHVNPDDAKRLGLTHGGSAKVASRVGAVVAEVEITPSIMPGVVSLPHGFGQGGAGERLSVVARRPGVNSNILTDEEAIDPLSGNAVLNGIPVTVEAANAAAAE